MVHDLSPKLGNCDWNLTKTLLLVILLVSQYHFLMIFDSRLTAILRTSNPPKFPPMFRPHLVPVVAALFFQGVYAADPVVSPGVGDSCPGFSGITDQDQTLKLSDFRGSRKVVLFFYPADMTRVCTAQARGFQQQMQEFDAADTVVIGISGDFISNHEVFRSENQLTFPLIADPKGKIAKAFGVPVREGGEIVRRVAGQPKTFRRGVTAGRWTFVVDTDGTIIHKDTNVNAEENSASVLKVVRQLTASAE